MAIQTVGIIGAGTMGNGIAQACAVAGVNVVMVDIAQAAVDKGVATVSGSLDRTAGVTVTGSASGGKRVVSRTASRAALPHTPHDDVV